MDGELCDEKLNIKELGELIINRLIKIKGWDQLFWDGYLNIMGWSELINDILIKIKGWDVAPL